MYNNILDVYELKGHYAPKLNWKKCKITNNIRVTVHSTNYLITEEIKNKKYILSIFYRNPQYNTGFITRTAKHAKQLAEIIEGFYCYMWKMKLKIEK